MPDDVSIINLNDLTNMDLTNMSALDRTYIHNEVIRKYTMVKNGGNLLDDTNLLDIGDIEAEYNKIKQILSNNQYEEESNDNILAGLTKKSNTSKYTNNSMKVQGNIFN